MGARLLHLCPTLCHPMDRSLPGSRMLQARILEWVVIPFSRKSSRPRNWTWVSRIAEQILYHLSQQGNCTNTQVNERRKVFLSALDHTADIRWREIFYKDSGNRNIWKWCLRTAGGEATSLPVPLRGCSPTLCPHVSSCSLVCWRQENRPCSLQSWSPPLHSGSEGGFQRFDNGREKQPKTNWF